MIYKAKNYRHLLGIEGFSHKLLKNHFELYEGYIKNSNKLLIHLDELFRNGQTDTIEFSEIKRRLAFELNGIKLHEYYFENMKKDTNKQEDKDSSLFEKIKDEFGSYQDWKKSFQATVSLRGVGWAMVIYDPAVDRIWNTWVTEHHIGHIAGTTPLLVLDLWEHAMLLDYGSDRALYLEAFFNVIDWSVIQERYEKAVNDTRATILHRT